MGSKKKIPGKHKVEILAERRPWVEILILCHNSVCIENKQPREAPHNVCTAADAHWLLLPMSAAASRSAHFLQSPSCLLKGHMKTTPP